MVNRALGLMGIAPQTVGTLIVWALALVALMVLGLSVVLMRETVPPVTLDMAGLTDRRWSPQPLAWLDIAEFDPVRRLGVEMVQLRLKEGAGHPPATLVGKLARKTGLVAPGTLVIPMPGLECSAEALCDKILEIGTAAVHAAEEAAEREAAKATAADGAAMQNN
ncbi:hypothetical protein [Sandarakinorhabdus oryzae]|uniref:hypothetical protein n=1 Tax=Sandarakinorhabdus oryzae TaxID=2675220 RepID=UPI001A9C4BAE|nr:hypothetical protein [Sandarakinorhabdus oryzae]